MRVTVIPSDKAVYIDDEVLFFDFECDENIHAIQWMSSFGVIEYKHHNRTEEFSDANIVQCFIDAFNAEKTRIDEEILSTSEEE